MGLAEIFSNTNALNPITVNGISPHPIPLPSGLPARSRFGEGRGEGRVRGPLQIVTILPEQCQAQ